MTSVPDTTLLWHAAAGGVGLIACQWLKSLGATVIGTAGSDEKCKLAKDAGATHTINYAKENFVERVKEITGGKLCDVVYDLVGKDTFPSSLDCIKPRRPVRDLRQRLGPGHRRRSRHPRRQGLALCHPAVADGLHQHPGRLRRDRQRPVRRGQEGRVKIAVNHTYPLKDAAQAHRDLEGRKTTGSIVLLP